MAPIYLLNNPVLIQKWEKQTDDLLIPFYYEDGNGLYIDDDAAFASIVKEGVIFIDEAYEGGDCIITIKTKTKIVEIGANDMGVGINSIKMNHP